MPIQADINNSPQAADKDALVDMTTVVGASYSTECMTPQPSYDECDVRPRRPLPRLPKGKNRSTEKLMNAARRVQKVSLAENVYRDDHNAISEHFAAELQSKMVHLTIRMYNTGVPRGKAEKRKCGLCYLEGQGGFVLFPGETSNAVFVTAKHNLFEELDEEGMRQCVSGHEIQSHQEGNVDIVIPGRGQKKKDAKPHFLHDGSYWNSGLDVSIGPCIDEAGDAVVAWVEGNEVTPFDVVESDFVLCVGMKIGIVVYSIQGAADVEPCELFLDNFALDEGVEISDIYGEPHCVVVYTGQITRVGEAYFEHDINTFQGCSGAIVFLLDQQQGEIVSAEDYKKAIGVHAGHKEQLGVNIAFRLVKPEVKVQANQSIMGCICRIFSGKK